MSSVTGTLNKVLSGHDISHTGLNCCMNTSRSVQLRQNHSTSSPKRNDRKALDKSLLQSNILSIYFKFMVIQGASQKHSRLLGLECLLIATSTADTGI